jgi:spermidine synthase
VLAALAFVSGAVLVAAEVLWARDFALVLGSTAAGTAVVLAATFAGLAVGSAVGGRTRAGAGVFARVQAGFAVALVGYVVLRPSLATLVVSLEAAVPGGARIVARILAAMLVLATPTVLAGAALPAVAEGRTGEDVRGMGGLYAWSTIGGAAGALAVPFVLLGRLGVRGSYLGLAALAAATAVAASRRAPTTTPASSEASGSTSGRALALAATTGFVGLGGEVLWTRALAGELSSSVYSVAIVLATVLAGIVVGTAAGSLRRGRLALAPTLAVLGVVVLASTMPLGALARWTLVRAPTDLGSGLALEATLAASVVLASAILLGAAFPAVLALARADTASRTLGRVLAANTLGGVAGALGAAFVLLPRLGIGGGLAVLAAVAFAGAALAAPGRGRWPAAIAALCALGAAPQVGTRLEQWTLPAAEHVVFAHDGAAATVMVTEDARGARRLRVNGRYSLGGADGLLLERREGHVPLLLHPAPHHVLHIGVGTGDTMAAELAHPGVEADGLELLGDVLDATAWFDATNGGLGTNPRAHLVADDARSWLLRTDRRYDVIVADLFLPWTAGASAVYSRDFYSLLLARLAPGGLVCHWLPLHQLGVGDLEAIVATFAGVFPQVELWVAYHRTPTPLVALVGRRAPAPIDVEALRRRMAAPELASALREVGLADPRDLGALYVTDGPRLRAATSGAATITDDRPLLELSAPAAYFRGHELSAAGLAWATARLDPGSPPIVGLTGVTAELRALLLTGQLALLAGRSGDEVDSYLRAAAIAPGLATVDTALRAMASSRRAAGDATGAARIERALAPVLVQ